MNIFGHLFSKSEEKPTYNIACTSFAVKNSAGNVFHGRSMEFPKMPMQSSIVFHTIGEQCQSTAPGDGTNPTGVSWTAKYGYAGVTVFNAGVVDGLNQAGLSCSFNSLNCSQYQTVPPGCNNQALELFDVGGWLLGNFSNVNDAITGLKTVYVWGKFFPLLNKIPGLHIALHDTAGNSAVVEYLNGNLTVAANPYGVMTNDPPFSWQTINLSNYNYVSPNAAQDVVYNGVTIPALGPGTGMPLPGGFDAVSRFVKVFQLCRFATLPTSSDDMVETCIHILNNVDKPTGVCLIPYLNQTLPEMSKWCVIKDLSAGDLYYYSHKNTRLKVVHVAKMNLASGQKYPPLSVDAGHEKAKDMTPVIP